MMRSKWIYAILLVSLAANLLLVSCSVNPANQHCSAIQPGRFHDGSAPCLKTGRRSCDPRSARTLATCARLCDKCAASISACRVRYAQNRLTQTS